MYIKKNDKVTIYVSLCEIVQYIRTDNMSSPSKIVLSAKDVREKFIDFFTKDGHKYIKPHSLIPPDDSILFTNSGMCQFKKIFLGEESASCDYACNIQKCIRAGGKHNDFDDVGYDTYHHTMFNMMGNWQFNCDPNGKFKYDAIERAWTLLVKIYGLDPKRIYVTYFAGNDILPSDIEVRDLWSKYLPMDRILPFGMKENFWQMSHSGPCGPCTEIHYDLAPEQHPDSATDLVNKDDPTVIELWNLVFIQYNLLEDGRFERLRNVFFDSGAGAERLVTAVQGKTSNYDTDVFQSLFAVIEKVSAKSYAEEPVSFRIIADHLRTLIYAINDDVVPYYEGRGFILTKLFKRASYYAYTHLKLQKTGMTKLVSGILNALLEEDETLRPNVNKIKYILDNEEAKHGTLIWKGALLFRQLLDKDNKIVTKSEYEMITKTRGISVDVVEQFCKDHKFTLENSGN